MTPCAPARRSYRRGCADGPEARLRRAQDATRKRFKLAQWFTHNVRDKVPGVTYVGLDVLDPNLWNMCGDALPKVRGYMVAVEVADETVPTVEDRIVLASLASGDLTMLRWTSRGYRTMKDVPCNPPARYIGDVCLQSWSFR